MSRVNVHEFLDFDFAQFGDLAQTWQAYLRTTSDHADTLRIDICKHVAEEHFHSLTAIETRRQFRIVADHIDDDLDLFVKRVRNVLEDAAEEFQSHQSALRQLVDSATSQGLNVSGDGSVTVRPQSPHPLGPYTETGLTGPAVQGMPPLGADDLPERRALAEQAQAAMNNVLTLIAHTDDSLTQRLRSLSDESPSMPELLGKNHSEDAKSAADEVMALWGNGDLTEAQLAELIELLELYEGSPEFATHLLEGLGPDGFLNMSGHIGYMGVDPSSSDTPGLVGDFQELMAGHLSLATNDTDPKVGDSWIDGLMEAGAQPVNSSSFPEAGMYPGYMALGPILTHGTFDERLLVPVTEHLIAVGSAEYGTLPAWAHASDNPFDPTNTLSGSIIDPAFIALDNNPSAATEVFAGDSQYSRDSYPNSNGDPFPSPTNPMESLLGAGQTLPFDREIFGNAMEAATSGVPSDQGLSNINRPEHDERMAQATMNIIDYVGGNPDQFQGSGSPNSELIGNLGNIATHYVEDFHRAFSTDGTQDSNWMVQPHGAGLDFGSYDVNGQQNLKQFLHTIGQDPHTAGQFWAASEGIAQKQLIGVMAEEGNGDGAIRDALASHSRLMGEVGNGQFKVIAEGHWDAVEFQNNMVTGFGEGAKFVSGETIGKIPVAGTALSQGTGYIIDDFSGELKVDPRELIGSDQLTYQDTQSDVIRSRSEEMIEYALNHDDSIYSEIFRDDLDVGQVSDTMVYHFESVFNPERDEHMNPFGAN
ncbi:hypothetical protein [Natronoglycomyces albus]|uniref:Uncharacterized protein n=1 Tax=Natronoglycomyces albus TaxID=2811108 RepID=A0A895XK61_9ACTN|nr:hypothetical protein [Natronoglycomyces albus]QSB05427.1 hypothetical protein JQS30_00320 [Natronoglycomyces albus]